jgi:hypothetical protein
MRNGCIVIACMCYVDRGIITDLRGDQQLASLLGGHQHYKILRTQALKHAGYGTDYSVWSVYTARCYMMLLLRYARNAVAS